MENFEYKSQRKVDEDEREARMERPYGETKVHTGGGISSSGECLRSELEKKRGGPTLATSRVA